MDTRPLALKNKDILNCACLLCNKEVKNLGRIYYRTCKLVIVDIGTNMSAFLDNLTVR